MEAQTRATAVFVVYRTRRLDLSWIPDGVRVIVVHNDRSFDPSSCDRRGVDHVISPTNVGFGCGVNLALPRVGTERVVLANPDVNFTADHWAALSSGTPDDVRTVPITDTLGTPTSVVNRYPTALGLLLTGYRIGRLVPRASPVRRGLARLLGQWGREHTELTAVSSGTWSLADHWVSGVVVGVDTDRLRAVGGFDPGYFLYMEDVDLCRRLAARFPVMRITMESTPAAVHTVGGSAPDASSRRTVDRHYLDSVRRYARTEQGLRWRFADMALGPRNCWLGR